MADLNYNIVFFPDKDREKCIKSNIKIWREFYSMKTKEIIALDYTDRSPFEYLLLLGLLHPDVFYQQVEVAVPPNIPYHTYIKDNILQYEGLVDSLPEIAKHMPLEFSRKFYEKLHDNILISIIGGYPLFYDRNSLVDNIISLVNVNGWFILLIPDKKKIKNKDCITSLFSSLDELREDEEIVLAYGSSTEYYFYETEELKNSIYLDNDEELWKFINPQGGDKFSYICMYRLLDLLFMIKSVNSKADDLYKHIEFALKDSKFFSEEDKNMRILYFSMDEDEQKKIFEFLEMMFYSGMYMRKWKGPGHKYPLKEKDTFGNEDHQVKVTECLDLLKNYFNEDPIYNNFYVINKDNKEGYFIGLFNKVRSGDYCIRMASTRFISTAICYRILLMKEMWPDIDINDIDRIA